MIRPTASGRIAPIPPIVPIHSDTSNLYLHLFTEKIVRFPPFSNIHVDIFHFPRGRQKIPPKFHFILPKFHFIPPKFHLIPPRNFFFSTWAF